MAVYEQALSEIEIYCIAHRVVGEARSTLCFAAFRGCLVKN